MLRKINKLVLFVCSFIVRYHKVLQDLAHLSLLTDNPEQDDIVSFINRTYERLNVVQSNLIKAQKKQKRRKK